LLGIKRLPATTAVADTAVPTIPSDAVEHGHIVFSKHFHGAGIRGGGGPGAAGILPLGLGGQSINGVPRETLGGLLFGCESLAKLDGLQPTDVVDGHVGCLGGADGGGLVFSMRLGDLAERHVFSTHSIDGRVIEHFLGLVPEDEPHDGLPLLLSDFGFAQPETASEGDPMRVLVVITTGLGCG
jgi:hypothetical protein